MRQNDHHARLRSTRLQTLQPTAHHPNDFSATVLFLTHCIDDYATKAQGYLPQDKISTRKLSAALSMNSPMITAIFISLILDEKYDRFDS